MVRCLPAGYASTAVVNNELLREDAMQITARNKLEGTVTSIKLGGVMAEVVVRVGDNEIVSVVTRTSAEELELTEGDRVTAIIKSTEVMLAR